jgi:hypothetical protein
MHPLETLTAVYQVMEMIAGPDTARSLIDALNASAEVGS